MTLCHIPHSRWVFHSAQSDQAQKVEAYVSLRSYWPESGSIWSNQNFPHWKEDWETLIAELAKRLKILQIFSFEPVSKRTIHHSSCQIGWRNSSPHIKKFSRKLLSSGLVLCKMGTDELAVVNDRLSSPWNQKPPDLSRLASIHATIDQVQYECAACMIGEKAADLNLQMEKKNIAINVDNFISQAGLNVLFNYSLVYLNPDSRCFLKKKNLVVIPFIQFQRTYEQNRLPFILDVFSLFHFIHNLRKSHSKAEILLHRLSAADHQLMIQKLGIAALRPVLR